MVKCVRCGKQGHLFCGSLKELRDSEQEMAYKVQIDDFWDSYLDALDQKEAEEEACLGLKFERTGRIEDWEGEE